MKRIFPTIFVLCLLFGLIRLFRTAQQYDPSNAMAKDQMGNVSIEMEDCRISSTRSGAKEWDISTRKLSLNKSSYGGLDSYSLAVFDGIHNGKLYRDGKQEATLSAQHAEYDPQKGAFQASGNIELKTTDGDKLSAPGCLWSERDDVVRLESGMTGIVDGHNISSPYVLFNPKKRLVACPQGAETELDGLPIRAKNLKWDIKNRKIVCDGKISGKRPSGDFTALRGEIYLSTEGATRPGLKLKNSVDYLRLYGGTMDLTVDMESDAIDTDRKKRI